MDFENTLQITQAAFAYLRRSECHNECTTLNKLLNKIIKKRRKSRRRIWTFPKSNHYFSEIWCNYEDSRFIKKYRMSKQTFDYICYEIADMIGKKDTQMRECVPVTKRVAVALHFLKSNCDADTIADLYGIGRSTAAQLLLKWEFPGCFGALDGSHIPIITPSEDPLDYFNYKKYHSIVLMAAVDASYKFIMTNIGQTGRNADSTVFSRTTLYKKLNEGSFLHQNQNYHLISDAAFPLHEWLMKPFIDNEHTPAYQKHFNYRLSRARMTIENAFGRLKGRWRILLKRMDHRVENCVKIVRACTILHNICEMHRHEYFETWEDESQISTEIFSQPETRSHNSNSRIGETKRENIATTLLPLATE